NGQLVGAALVAPSDEIMLITKDGVMVRTRVDEVREMGRATQGVTLINVDENSLLRRIRRVTEREADDIIDEQDEQESDGAERANNDKPMSDAGTNNEGE